MLVVRGTAGVIEEITKELERAEAGLPKPKSQKNYNAGRYEGATGMANTLLAVFQNAVVLSEEEFDAWRDGIELRRQANGNAPKNPAEA